MISGGPVYFYFHYHFKVGKMAAKRITLPGTNLNVSRVCLGCWQFNGGKDTVNWDAQTPEVGVVIAIHRFPSVTRGPQFRCEVRLREKGHAF